MLRVPLWLAFGIVGNLVGADLAGRWAGTTNANGSVAPIYLMLNQSGQTVPGSITTGQTHKPVHKPVPIQNAEVHGYDLTFAVQENTDRLINFALTLMITGQPLGDREIILKGHSKVGDQDCEVVLYPTREESPFTEGGITSTPVLVHKIEPSYSEQAREARIQGTVLLQVEIEPTGMIAADHIRVLRSLGYGLDEQAIECVKEWRFKPAFRNGYAVKTKASVEVYSRL